MTTNNAVNAPFPLSATKGGLGVASPTAHGILIGEGASAVTPVVLGAGQVLVGTTASDPAATTITASGGISVALGSGSIAFTGSGTGFTWVDQTSSSVTMAVNSGYVTDNGASLVTYTLPSTAALGSVFAVVGFSSGGWAIAQQASQAIHLGNQVTTTGVGGSLASTNEFDVVYLVCVVANLTFVATSIVGNITYV